MSFSIKNQRKIPRSARKGHQPVRRTAPNPISQPVRRTAPNPISQPVRRTAPNPISQPVRRTAPRTATLDTHFYDGKLNDHSLVNTIKTLQKICTPELATEKRLYFEKLSRDISSSNYVENKYRPTALQALTRISQNIRQAPNFDHSNGLHADDILYLICKQIYEFDRIDIIVYLVEQLSDIITSGQCPQGRCTRLFQIFSAVESQN